LLAAGHFDALPVDPAAVVGQQAGDHWRPSPPRKDIGCGGRTFLFSGQTQGAPDRFRRLQCGDNLWLWRRVIEEDHSFASDALARVAAVQLPGAFAKPGFASGADNLDGVFHGRLRNEALVVPMWC
jgi:hypothetical protein